MMKVLFQKKFLPFACFLIILSLSTSACITDSSPLRSDMEVAINKTFGMDFGYLDQVFVLKNGEEIHNIKGESVRGIVFQLAKATKIEEKLNLPDHTTYKIILSTSKESVQYSKDQTEAEILVYPQGDLIYLRYGDQLYELSESLSSYGIT